MNRLFHTLHPHIYAFVLALFVACTGTAPSVPESEYYSTGIPSVLAGTTLMNTVMVSPIDKDSNIPLDANIVFVFPDTVNDVAGNISSNVTISGSLTGGIAYIVAGTGTTVTLNPSVNFQAGETITININSALQNAALTRTLDKNYVFTFDAGTATTGTNTPPYVLVNSQYPPKGALNISRNLPYVELTFNKAVANVVANTTFTITPGSGIGVANPGGNTWRLNLTTPLAYGTAYTVRVHGTPSEAIPANRVRDLIPNDLVDNGEQQWTFTTETDPGAPANPVVDTSWSENVTISGGDIYFTTTGAVDVSTINCRILYDTVSRAAPPPNLYAFQSGVEGNWDGGSTQQILHRITLAGLTATRTYYYRVWLDLANFGTVDAGETSGEFTFMTRKAASVAANNQNGQVILQTALGGGFVFWESTQAGNFDIYGQFFSTTGAPQWASPGGMAVTTVAANHRNIAITGDGAGGAIIVYQDTATNQLYAKRITAAGIFTFGGGAGSAGVPLNITIQALSVFSVVRNAASTNFLVGYIDNATGRPAVREYLDASGAPVRYRGPGRVVTSSGYGQPVTVTTKSIGPITTIANAGNETVATSGYYNNSLVPPSGPFHIIVTNTGAMNGINGRITWDYNGGAGTNVWPLSGVPFALGASGVSFTITDGAPAGLVAADEWDFNVSAGLAESLTVDTASDYDNSLGNGTFNIYVSIGGTIDAFGTGTGQITYDFGGGPPTSTFVPTDGAPFQLGATNVWVILTDGGDGILNMNDHWTVAVGNGASAYADTVSSSLTYTGTGNGTFTLTVTAEGPPDGTAEITWDYNGGAGTPVSITSTPFTFTNINGSGINITFTDGGDNWLNLNDEWTVEVGDRIAVSGVAGFTRVDLAANDAANRDFFAVCSSATRIDASSWDITNNTYPLHSNPWAVTNICDTAAPANFGWANVGVDQVARSAIFTNKFYLLAHNTAADNVGLVEMDDAAPGINWASQFAGRDPHMVIDDISGGADERELVAYRFFNGTNYLIRSASYSSAGAPTGPWNISAVAVASDSDDGPRITLADSVNNASPFYVTWFDGRLGAGNYEVYSSQVTAAGVVNWSALIYDTASIAGNLRVRALYYNDVGNQAAYWGLIPLWVESTDLYYELVQDYGRY